MDVTALQASLQALMDQRAQTPAPAAAPPPQPVQELPAQAEPDPFFEQYFVPAAQPVEQTQTFEPVELLDDHLLENHEKAGEVKITDIADALYRAKRTGYQGLIASVLIALGGVLASLQVDAPIDWKLMGVSLGQALLTAAVTFLHNDPSKATTPTE